MALAPLAHVLFTRVMHHDPAAPLWPDRDRFILSNGHASILSVLDAVPHRLRADPRGPHPVPPVGSKTPGHPEVHLTAGVEVTTGPLGQGFGNGVGMGIAERWLRARFGPELVDHHTFVICSDGDLMEGISHEAASLAGHLGLGRLVYVYDNNHITIDGPTELAYTDDVAERFDAYGWHTDDIGEVANDTDALESALRRAMAVEDKPSHDPPPQPHRLALPPQDRHRRGAREPSRRGGGQGDQGHPRAPPRRDVLGARRGPRLTTAGAAPRVRARRAAWDERLAAWNGDRAAWDACQHGTGVQGWAEKLPVFDPRRSSPPGWPSTAASRPPPRSSPAWWRVRPTSPATPV